MSWWERIVRLFNRPDQPKLASVPAQETVRSADVEHLAVRTADTLIIVTLDPAAVPHLLEAATQRHLLQLTAPDSRPVTLVPVDDEITRPVLDPNEGWIIPLSQATADLVRTTLNPERGDYLLGESGLAVVVI